MKNNFNQKKTAAKTIEIETEQKLKEIPQENQNQLQNIFLNAPAAIAIFEGPEHKYILANKAYEKLSNRKAADLLGKSMEVLFPELIGTGTVELYDKVLETGESFSAPEYALMLDLKNEGVLRQYYFNFSMEPLRNDSGEIYTVMAITYDVTEQVESRKKIEESEQRFRNLVEQAPVAFCLFRGENFVVEVANEKQLQLTGKTKEEVMNIPAFTSIPETVAQGYQDIVEGVYKTGIPFIANESPLTIIHNGKAVTTYINFVLEPFYNAEHKIDGVFSVTTDVTEQVLARKIIEESELEIRKIKEQLELSIQAGKIGVWHWDVQEDILSWSKEQKEMFGVEQSENITNVAQFQSFVIPEDWERLLINIQGPNIKLDQEYDFRIKRRNDGEIRWLKSKSKVVLDETGNIKFISGVNIDVSEQLFAQKKVEESEKQFKNVLFQSPNIFVILEGFPEMIITFANEPLFKSWGRTAAIIGKPLLEALPEIKDQPFPKLLQQVFETGKTYYSGEEKAVIIKNGVTIDNYYIYVYQAIFDNTQKVTGVIIMATDITEQVVARKKIEESEEKYRTLITSIDQGFTLCELIRNKEGKAIDFYILEVNPTYEKQTGVTKEMVLGKPLMQVFPSLEKWMETYAAVVDNQCPVVIENYFEDMNRWFENKAYPVGKERFIVLFSDITERKQDEEKLKESEKQQAFLLKFSDNLRAEPTIDAVANCALQMLSEYLKLDRCYIGVYHLAEDRGAFPYQVGNERVPPMPDSVSLSDFPDALRVAFDRTLVIDDVTKAEGLADTDRHNLSALGLCALVAATLRHGENNPLWSIVAVSASPRDWTLSEVKLIEEVTERTWTAVERAKGEEAQRKSEEKYRSLFNSIYDAFCIIEMIFDENGKPVDWIYRETNPAFSQHATMEMNGKRISEIVPEIETFWLEKYGGVAKTGEPVQLVHIVKGLGDQWFQTSAFRYGPEGNNKVAVLFRNITEQKIAEETVRKSEEKYRTLFTSIDQGFSLCELVRNKEGKGIDFRVLEVNPTSEKHTGVSMKMVLGKTILQVIPALDTWWIETYTAVVDNQRSVVFEKYFEDTNRWFEINAYPGEEDMFAILFSDITERKQAEENIQESEKQLRELSSVLEQKVDQRTIQLEEKNRDLQNMNKELEAFAYVSSHDLQEPLRKILTFTGLILEKENQNLSDNGKNYFRLMQDSAKQMQQLISDLLDFSRVNISERKFENTDLSVIIEEVKKEFEEAIAEKHAVIEVKEICEVHIIAFQFRQLMHNLISNALKFSNSKRPPHIKITSRNITYDKLNIKALSPAKEYCHITITDNGIGFEKEFSTKIFEVFQRLHGKEEYKGTGIGLAIVKKIVDNHNGVITATSELDNGATFNIYLPIRQPSIS